MSATSDLAKQASALSLLFLFENSKEALPDLTRFLAGINSLPDPSFLVITNDRCGLLVICDQSIFESIGIVI